MQNDETSGLLAFSAMLGRLKTLVRYQGQYFWDAYPEPARFESVADHSWRLAMLVLIMKDRLSRPFDFEKALQMALVHDVPEILAGDESPSGPDGTGRRSHAFNEAKAEERHQREAEAARKIFGALPGAGDAMLRVWEEYEAQACFEANVVRALDKIEATMQVVEYRNGQLFPEHLEFAIAYASKFFDVDPAIRAFGEAALRNLRDRYTPFERSVIQ